MPIKIAVISDTHCSEWDEVHPDMRTLVAECDMAIHCGDIVRLPVVEGFLKSAKKGLIVHGNSDPVDLRESLPYTQVIEIEKIKKWRRIQPAQRAVEGKGRQGERS